MTDTVLRYDGRLVLPWGNGKPTLAQAYVPPFYDALDFDSYRLMGRDNAVRAHVTYPDHYLLLEAILTAITHEAGGIVEEVLINSRMPSVVRVPQSFFGRNVMFMNAPLLEARRLAREGTCVFAIEEKFLRHTVENADNTLTLHWFNAPEDGPARMDKISARLVGLGLRPEERVAA